MTNTIPHDHQPQQEQAPVVKKPQMKKQARRRTHASRPYQERLLNMAEARREIVTALKIHRANMRQLQPAYPHQADTLLRQSPSLQLQQKEQQQQQVQVVFQDRSQAVDEEAPLLAPTSYASFAGHQLCNPLAHWIAAAPAGSYYYSSPVLPYDLTPFDVPTAMGGLEQLARSLPAQPLGLNLSFQSFGGGSIDGASKDYEDVFGGVPLIQSSSPAASSYSAYSPPATEMVSGTHGSPALSTAEKYSSPAEAPAAALTPVLHNGETMSAGETQCVEWGEATVANVAAASAWWSKILLESIESGGGEVVAERGAVVGCTVEDAVAAAGLPAEWRWLCDDGVGEQGAVTGGDKPPDVLKTMPTDGDYNIRFYEGGCRSDGAVDGITLPCMDEDLEGWDGEWFSSPSS
ncbi:hypothetical protein BAE44_0017088 [Dichanthelium oligosanthes]|uniref:Uncharacterized protein n=1 Tax=Dichanthelium oligosanthes TaxID=888268 RepID=A0A1E5VA52_9POAL|nr:hypothetical protein BAE44_0017088 [Dichanthelium oligosanthes]